VGAQQHDEGVVADRLAPGGALADLVAVEEDAERVQPALPVATGHAAAVRAEPPDVGQARAERRLAGEEAGAPEDRVAAPKGDHAAREREQLRIRAVPVEPRELVVLAPGVVVAALRAPDLVAAEQHRDALREQQRREEVALSGARAVR
jgi:hypothetical protein